MYTVGNQTAQQDAFHNSNSKVTVVSHCTDPGTVCFTISNTAHDGGAIAVYKSNGRLLSVIAIAKGSRNVYWGCEAAKGIYFIEINLVQNGSRTVRLRDKLVVK